MNIDKPDSDANRDINLLGMLAVGSEAYITGQERAGQSQLVNSTSLPTDMGGNKAEFEKLGFVFGTPDGHDLLFRPVTLPDGWSKQPSDHSMWSYVVDELGRRRVSVFYKAAFYDRSAHMSLETLTSYARALIYDGKLPVYDDTWCTPESFAEAAAKIRARLAEDAEDIAAHAAAQPGHDYWPGRAAELQNQLAAHDVWMVRVTEAATR